MFTGEKVDADRCAQIGLVNRVVPDERLQEEAFAFARSLAEGPSLALRAMKDNLDDALTVDFDTARDREAERLIPLTMISRSQGGGAGLHREAQGGVQGKLILLPAAQCAGSSTAGFVVATSRKLAQGTPLLDCAIRFSKRTSLQSSGCCRNA